MNNPRERGLSIVLKASSFVMLACAPFYVWNRIISFLDGGEIVPAARMSQWDKVKALVNSGTDPNSENDRGETALMWAADGAPADVVELLLRKGADPKHRNYSWGTSAWDYARNRPNDENKRRILALLRGAQKDAKR